MAKLVYFTRELDSADNGGRLNFINFETHRIDLCIDFIRQLNEEHERLNGSSPEGLCVVATGGGAYMYYDKLKEALNVNIKREEEMQCLITGMPEMDHIRRAKRAQLTGRPRLFHHGNPKRSVHVQ